MICVAATGRTELVFFFVFKTSAGTSDEVDYGDCRHVCDDEESHHEDLEEGDHVHEVQYWVVRIVWSCFPFPLCNVFVFMLFGLYGDLTNAFGSVKWEAMDRAAEALLGPNHFLGQQRYRLATTTIPGNDGNISLKIGEGGLMGDPLMVALFWVAFLPSTIRWQQLVAEEGAESGQLLAWHPWSGERMDQSLSQYADDTTKQIVAKPGEDVQVLAKRVQCSNDVFDRTLAVDGFSQNRGKEELLMHLVGEGSLADRRLVREGQVSRCQAKSSQWRGISAATWEKRHPSLMSSPGGVKPQWRLFTQLVSCGMRAGCRGDSNVASSSVVWSTRHCLASSLSARRRHNTKLSRLW